MLKTTNSSSQVTKFMDVFYLFERGIVGTLLSGYYSAKSVIFGKVMNIKSNL